PGATAKLRARLEEERDQALASLRGEDGEIGAVLGELEQARTRAAAWTFESEGIDALGPGLNRIYSRGRKAMQRAGAEPSRKDLQRQARKLGSKLYARPTKRFVKAIERSWNRNAQPVAS